jgi:hypothetical protein
LEGLGGADYAEAALHAAHAQYTGACCALRAAVALCLEAFNDGTIAATTLGRACRTSLADPKKVIHRYQRAYVMWAVQAPQVARSLQLATADDGHGHGHGHGEGRSGGGGGHGSSHSSSSGPATVASFAAPRGVVCDPASAAAMETRHVLVTASLRHLLVTTARVVKLVTGRETRPRGGVGVLPRPPPAPHESFSLHLRRPCGQLGVPHLLTDYRAVLGPADALSRATRQVQG